MNKSSNTRRFLDSLRLYIQAGRGGNGFPKFGGVGGKGGDVYVEGVKDQTLAKTRKASKGSNRWKAENGQSSSQFRILGEAGKDLVIPAPLGTSIQADMRHTLGEILVEGDKVLVARGGLGGNADNQFGGQKGEVRNIKLLLKLIADIGLVGFPNAGKSTFLRAVSHAKPKVASYPFTTLHPNIGIMVYEDGRKISVADLPGLIEGAWINKGMGHNFLRHVERTKLLLFVVDIDGFRLGPEYPSRSAIENIILLNRELELYQPQLVDKPSVLLLNKMDLPDSDKTFNLIRDKVAEIKGISLSLPEEMRPENFVSFQEILSCSAKYDRESVKIVKEKLRTMIDLNYDSDEDIDFYHDKIKENLYDKNMKLV